MISGHKIKKSFLNNGVRTEILKGVSIDVSKGEFVIITGRSGSGKSTLLNVLSTLTDFDEGSLIFEGQLVNHRNEKFINNLRKKDIAFIFQLHYLIPYLTAIENVMLPFCNSFMISGKDIFDAAKLALDQVGLSGKYNRLPGELSGGEQQRVAIARGIVKNPKVIFADEPTGSLDKNTSFNIMEYIVKLNEKGTTIIMVTHENDFTKFATKKYFMEDGELYHS